MGPIRPEAVSGTISVAEVPPASAPTSQTVPLVVASPAAPPAPLESWEFAATAYHFRRRPCRRPHCPNCGGRRAGRSLRLGLCVWRRVGVLRGWHDEALWHHVRSRLSNAAWSGRPGLWHRVLRHRSGRSGLLHTTTLHHKAKARATIEPVQRRGVVAARRGPVARVAMATQPEDMAMRSTNARYTEEMKC